MQDVYADWVIGLSHLSIGAIDYGIRVSKQNPYPPSQGEFIENCKDYVPPIIAKMIGKEQQKEISKEQAIDNLAKIKAMLKIKTVV